MDLRYIMVSLENDAYQIGDLSNKDVYINGRAKFVHQSGYAADSSWLAFKNPAEITGIKATITIESCTGDAGARISGFLGKDGENQIWTAIGIRADRNYLFSELVVLGPAPEYEYMGDYFWGRFNDSQDIVGSTFTISIIFSRKQGTYEVENDGILVFDFPKTLTPTPPDENFKGIGTRSNDGSGACTVYFDDVYVLRQSVPVLIGVTNLLLLD